MKPIPTNHLFSACAAVAALLPLSTSAAVIAIPAAGTSGFVSAFNPALTITATAPASNITLAAFTTNVSTAFTGGNGGVINFNKTTTGEIQHISGDNYAGTLALNKNFSVTITDPGSNFRQADFSSAGSTSVSTGGADLLAANNNNTTSTFTLGISGSGYAVGEQIRQVGFAVLNRTHAPNPSFTNPYTVVFTLDDATTVTLTDSVASGNVNTDNTFFGYQASGDRFITRFTINSGNANQPWLIDDLGFVVAIPEPSAALLGAVGMLALLTNRRRNG